MLIAPEFLLHVLDDLLGVGVANHVALDRLGDAASGGDFLGEGLPRRSAFETTSRGTHDLGPLNGKRLHDAATECRRLPPVTSATWSFSHAWMLPVLSWGRASQLVPLVSSPTLGKLGGSPHEQQALPPELLDDPLIDARQSRVPVAL